VALLTFFFLALVAVTPQVTSELKPCHPLSIFPVPKRPRILCCENLIMSILLRLVGGLVKDDGGGIGDLYAKSEAFGEFSDAIGV
jgi:hypothetical protein